MNAQVHFWIVSDAVQYIKSHGDKTMTGGLQAFEIAYGEDICVHELDYGKTAVEYLAGFEAWHTDKFGDLSLELVGGPWPAKRDITGMAGHLFTAFNHFVNPYPDEGHPWAVSGGYSYDDSSRTGVDSFVMKGISEYLLGRVDNDNTTVFERIRSGWLLGPSDWKLNLQSPLEEMRFAPWTVLGPFYYDWFLFRHFEPIEVRGPNNSIAGLQALGPVFHAATDCCSMQHVRPALGYQHQVWENYTQAMVFRGKIKMDPGAVSEILGRTPFKSLPKMSTESDLEILDLESFLRSISLATASTLSQSMGLGWGGIWDMDDQGWKDYIAGPSIAQDTQYLYNQAVAATVVLIQAAFSDLEQLGVIDGSGKLADGTGKHALELEQSKFDQWPPTPPQGTETEDIREEYLLRAAGPIAGAPGAGRKLKEILDRLEAPVRSSYNRPWPTRGLRDGLTELERLLKEVYKANQGKSGLDFCPLSFDANIPLGSDMSAHFGSATYRLPSKEECDDQDALRGYMEKVELHSYKAHLVQLTQAIVSLELNLERFKEESKDQAGAEAKISELRKLRDQGLDRDGLIVEGNTPEKDREVAQDYYAMLVGLFDKITDFLSMPQFAVATVVAAALALVLILPRGGPELQFGLSSVDWEKPAFSVMGPPKEYSKAVTDKKPRPKLAMVIVFQNVEQAKEQKVVDSFYRNLEPTQAMENRYRIIAPYKLKESVKKGEIKVTSRDAFLESLKKGLNVSKVLLAQVRGHGEDKFTVQSELVDLANGKATMSHEAGAKGFEAASKLRETALSLFEDQESQ